MYVHYTTLMNSAATYIFQILMPSSNFHTPCANLEILLHYRLAFDPASRARSRKLARTALVTAWEMLTYSEESNLPSNMCS